MSVTQQGFPDSSSISPQVLVAIEDRSLVSSPTNPHNVALVGFASKGPINIPTLVTSRNDLYAKFGFPHPADGDPHLIYAAELVLQNVSSVTIVRVAQTSTVSDEAALTASYNIPSAGGQVEIESNTAGSYVFSVDSFFRWRLNDVLASKTLVVLAGTYTVTQLVTALNNQLVSADGIEFYSNGSSKISVKTTFSYGVGASLELVSVTSAIYGPSSVTGLGTLMTKASLTGSATKYPNNVYTAAGTYNFTGLTGLNLQVVIDGTDSTSIDGIVQVIDLSDVENQSNVIADISTLINTQITDGVIPGGFVSSVVSNNLKFTTLHAGRDAAILVKSSSTASSIFGFSNVTAYGTSPSGVSGDGTTYTDGLVTGNADISGTITFVVNADSPGIEGNNTSVQITNSVTGDGTFTIQVLSSGNIIESWSNLTKDQTAERYVGTYLQNVSQYITVTDDASVTSLPLPGTYTLSGGTDGIPADADDQDTVLIGSATAMTGMQVLSDPNQVNVDIIAVPGHTSTSIATALISLCEERDDCFGIIDPPFGLTPTEIVQWQNGSHPLNNTRFNSNHAGIFYPWLKYGDVTNKVNVWIPPSGGVASTFAQSDNVSGGPWNAAAGENRGTIPLVTDTYTKPSLTELNSMYGFQNAVNPIIDDSVSGITIFGNKTLQREQTALTRINIMRMVFFAKKQIQSFGKTLLFEQHTPNLEKRAILLAQGVLSNMQLQGAISAFFIVCDSTINTPDVIDRGELRMQIGVQPVHAVEYIFVTFSLFKTGSFTQSA